MEVNPKVNPFCNANKDASSFLSLWLWNFIHDYKIYLIKQILQYHSSHSNIWNSQELKLWKKQLVGVWHILILLYKEAIFAADVRQKIKLEQHLHKMCQYETWIPGSTAECSAFAGAEINLAWLTQVLRVLVYHQNSHSSVYTKPQIYEKELTDWQPVLL